MSSESKSCEKALQNDVDIGDMKTGAINSFSLKLIFFVL